MRIELIFSLEVVLRHSRILLASFYPLRDIGVVVFDWTNPNGSIFALDPVELNGAIVLHEKFL